MTVTRMVLSWAQTPTPSSGGYDRHGDTALKGRVPTEHVPCICTVHPPRHQLYLFRNAHVLQRQWQDSLHPGQSKAMSLQTAGCWEQQHCSQQSRSHLQDNT